MSMTTEELTWSVIRMAKMLKLKSTWDDCLKQYGEYDSRTTKAEYLYHKSFEREYAKKRFINNGI